MRLTPLLLGIGVAFVAAQSAHAQDPVKVSPGLYKILLENDQVRVLEFRIPPGQKEAMHHHPASVVYVLSDGRAKSTTPKGETQIIESKSGQAVWMDSVTHSWEPIVGDGHVVIVEVKRPAGRPAQAKKP